MPKFTLWWLIPFVFFAILFIAGVVLTAKGNVESLETEKTVGLALLIPSLLLGSIYGLILILLFADQIKI